MHNSSARLAMAAAGGALALLMATPAYAQTTTIPIRADQVPTTAEDFQPEDQDCTDEAFIGLDENQDGWHFVLPNPSGQSFASLTVTFDTGSGAETAIITSRDPANPSEGNGWSGYFTEAAPGEFKHAWVITDAGWTLTAGEAEVENPGTPPPPLVFNLSHTCPGIPMEPTPTPTPTPSPIPTETPEPTPTATPTATTPAPSPTVAPSPQPEMPKTGTPVAGMVALGAGLVAGGVGLLAVRRRQGLADR